MQRIAYQGYLIQQTIHGWQISKNLFHIATASSLEAAKQIINGLV